MEKFVFEADIIVPRLESRRHRFVLNRDAMEKFLAEMPPPLPCMNLTLQDLRDLIRNDGEYMNVLKLKGDSESREFLLRDVAAQVWLNDIPWTVTQSTDVGQGDPRFGRLVAAYMENRNA
jgi:hypothetical protein